MKVRLIADSMTTYFITTSDYILATEQTVEVPAGQPRRWRQAIEAHEKSQQEMSQLVRAARGLS